MFSLVVSIFFTACSDGGMGDDSSFVNDENITLDLDDQNVDENNTEITDEENSENTDDDVIVVDDQNSSDDSIVDLTEDESSDSNTSIGNDSSSSNNQTIINIDVNCIENPTANDISNYITLQSGDVIVKDNDGAEVSIYHDSDGIKKVCLEIAAAHIIR
jgi:hypothetical protein